MELRKSYFADQRKDVCTRSASQAALNHPAMSPARPPISPTAIFPACCI
jgi:hypothetical protein